MTEVSKVSDLELAYRGTPMAVREDLLRFCGVWSPNLSVDPLEMARNEGRRLVGLYILQMLGEVTLPKETLCQKKR
jgi:hypothetical protein